MGTLSGMMNLATSALDAQQAAINTTSKNVANQTTAGYTREVTSFSETDAVTLNGTGSVGTGVTTSTSSQRDLVLESSLHLATQTASSASSRLDALNSLESLFGLSATDTSASSTAIGSALDGFSSSLTALSADPTDSATQVAVVAAAETLTKAFNSTATGLQQQTSDLNSEITTAAGQVDALTSTVASLNTQIASLRTDTDAGQLEDQRQLAIEQLSAIVGVNQITSDGNQISLTLSNGAALVADGQSYSLGTTTVNGNTEITAGDPSAVQINVTGGSIGGMLQARDTDIPAVSSSLDQLAYEVAANYNAANMGGVTTTGAQGSAIFSVASGVSGAAASISVSIGGPGGLGLASSGEAWSGTGNIATLTGTDSKDLVDGQTFSGFFSSVIGSVGNTVSAATTAATAATAAQTQAQTTRDALSGVSLDDEASSLMTYQRSYEAAAKVVTIVDELMESAINLGTESSV